MLHLMKIFNVKPVGFRACNLVGIAMNFRCSEYCIPDAAMNIRIPFNGKQQVLGGLIFFVTDIRCHIKILQFTQTNLAKFAGGIMLMPHPRHVSMKVH